jgi:hypothetical protein
MPRQKNTLPCIMKLNSMLLLAFVGYATAIGRPKSPVTVSPRNAAVVVVGKATSKTQHAALAVRGGAGPIDPTLLAKWTTGINLVNSIYTYLLPGKIRELYANMPYSPLSDLIFQRHGTALLACTLTAYCLLFQGTSVETAVGVSTLPFIIDLIRSELAGEPEKFGWPKYAQLAPLAFAAVTCYGCLNSKDWANTAMKVYSVWFSVTGFQAAFAPDSFSKLWNVKFMSTLTDIQKHSFQWWGFFLLGYAVYVGCLAWGVAPMKALGYGWVPPTVANAYFNVLSDQTKDFGMNRPMLFVWMVLGIVTTATLSFD